MCDSLVVVGEGGAPVWLAKNSDREPGESQVVEHRARERHAAGARLRATHIELDQVAETNEVVLSRPTWMWGAEMGSNVHGLAIGNEAVFTKVPVEPTGLLGMDLVRLALERASTADEALDLITWMLARHGQGGPAGLRDRGFSYHNAFLIADPHGAWLLETAGRFWAAERVRRGVRSTSNVLTIGADYTRIGPGTIEGARSLGLLRKGDTFDFRRCFGSRVMSWLSGGDVRRARTARSSGDLHALQAVVRDHGGLTPDAGARIVMPCAHASWQPTRGHGQTTGTMIARLEKGHSMQWLTGTSAPCLSVLKPVPLGRGQVDTGPEPAENGFDDRSLWWRAERLHREVLKDYDRRRAAFEEERRAMEARAETAATTTATMATDVWSAHRERVLAWTARVSSLPSRVLPRAFDAWWKLQSRRDGVPA